MLGTPGVRAKAENPCWSGHCPCPASSSHLPSCHLETDLQGDTVVWELLLYINLHDEVSGLGQLRRGVQKSGEHRGYKRIKVRGLFMLPHKCSPPKVSSQPSPHSCSGPKKGELQKWQDHIFRPCRCFLRQSGMGPARTALGSTWVPTLHALWCDLE